MWLCMAGVHTGFRTITLVLYIESLPINVVDFGYFLANMIPVCSLSPSTINYACPNFRTTIAMTQWPNQRHYTFKGKTFELKLHRHSNSTILIRFNFRCLPSRCFILGVEVRRSIQFTGMGGMIDFFYFWCLTPLSAIFQLFHGDQF